MSCPCSRPPYVRRLTFHPYCEWELSVSAACSLRTLLLSVPSLHSGSCHYNPVGCSPAAMCCWAVRWSIGCSVARVRTLAAHHDMSPPAVALDVLQSLDVLGNHTALQAKQGEQDTALNTSYAAYRSMTAENSIAAG